MKKLSIRQFQRNFYKELKGVPFIVTRQNPHTREDKPEYVVTAYPENQSSPTGEQDMPQQESQSEIPSQNSVAQVTIEHQHRSIIDKIFRK